MVEFKTERGSWVGNFKPGIGGINLAGVHPNKRDAVVVAAGDLWVVNPETRAAARVLSALDAALETREPDGWVFSRYGFALARFGPEGLIWHTRRLSSGGFGKLAIAQGQVRGVAEASYDGRSRYFRVDLATGESTQRTAGSKRAEAFQIRTVHILSPNMASILAMECGKYVCWTTQLDADRLGALLWAIGEFANRCTALRTPDGRLLEPVFYPHNMAEDRMRRALKIFAKLPSVGRVEWADAPFSGGCEPFELSEHVSAFSPAYRERVCQDAHTAWAQGLDERSLGHLLWMVGQYGIRVNSSQGPDGGEYPPPRFDGDPNITRPMRVALRVIAMIERGERMTSAEVSRRIAVEEV